MIAHLGLVLVVVGTVVAMLVLLLAVAVDAVGDVVAVGSRSMRVLVVAVDLVVTAVLSGDDRRGELHVNLAWSDRSLEPRPHGLPPRSCRHLTLGRNHGHLRELLRFGGRNLDLPGRNTSSPC